MVIDARSTVLQGLPIDVALIRATTATPKAI